MCLLLVGSSSSSSDLLVALQDQHVVEQSIATDHVWCQQPVEGTTVLHTEEVIQYSVLTLDENFPCDEINPV